MSDPSHPLFHRVLGPAFDHLPAAVRHAHGNGVLFLHGTAIVDIGLGPLGRLICWIMGLPRAGQDIPVTVDFTRHCDGTETWRRTFAGRCYLSRFSAGSGPNMVFEKMGLITVTFALDARRDRLRFEILCSRLLGMPLPRWLSPTCIADETDEMGAFRFDIRIGLPMLGRLIAYRGTLR